MNKKTVVFHILSAILIFITALTINLNSLAVKSLDDAGITRAVSNRLMDDVFNVVGVEMNTLYDTQENIENSKEMKTIIKILINDSVNEIADSESKSTDLLPYIEDLNSKICKGLKDKLSNKDYLQLEQSLDLRKGEIATLLSEAAHTYSSYIAGYGEKAVKAAKVYKTVTSIVFYIIIITAAALLYLISFLIEKDSMKSLKNLSIDFIASGFAVFLVNFFATDVLMKLSNRFIGRTVLIENMFIIQAIVLIGIGTGLQIVFNVLRRKSSV